MTPLLFRPFIPKVTTKDTNMLEPHQNSSHQTTPDFSTVQISSAEKSTLSKNYRDVPAFTGRKSLKSCVREDKECLVTSHKKVPKIVLHRTHPPHLSMHRGSRSYHHRFKQNNGDPFKQAQHGSLSSNQTANYQCGCTHCECCTKKVTKIT